MIFFFSDDSLIFFSSKHTTSPKRLFSIFAASLYVDAMFIITLMQCGWWFCAYFFVELNPYVGIQERRDLNNVVPMSLTSSDVKAK